MHIYWKAEQKCRKILNRFGFFIIFNQVLFITTFFYSIYCFVIKRVDIWELPLSFGMVVPFNTKTNWGWYLLWSIQFGMSFSYVSTMVSITMYFISCCTYIETMCDHFDLIIDSADELAANGKNEDRSKYSKMYKNVNKKLSRSIDIHNRICE